MNAGNGVLAMLAEPAMRDEVDRVAAAAGVAVVHVAHPPSRQAWTGASGGRSRRGRSRPLLRYPSLPRRAHVIMVSRGEPQARRLADRDFRRRPACDESARRRGRPRRGIVGGRGIRWR